MKIVSNPKKIDRYSKIGLYTSLASLVFLLGAVGLTLTMRTDFTTYSFAAMLVGLVLSQIGVYFANRWGKPPRIDERITQGLKGLDDRYTLYHYATPVPHLLVGPAGIWVIASMYQGGQISYENKRYRQQGIGLFSRIIGQEGIGNPDLEAQMLQQRIEKLLKNELPEDDLPPVKKVIVYTSPKATVQAQEAPVPTLHVEKLKDFVRRMAKESPAPNEGILKVQEILPAENVS